MVAHTASLLTPLTQLLLQDLIGHVSLPVRRPDYERDAHRFEFFGCVFFGCATGAFFDMGRVVQKMILIRRTKWIIMGVGSHRFFPRSRKKVTHRLFQAQNQSLIGQYLTRRAKAESFLK